MATRMMLNQEIDNTAKAEVKNDTAPEAKAAPAAPQNAPEDRYAHMFAEWDLLPPQMLIRRVTRRV